MELEAGVGLYSVRKPAIESLGLGLWENRTVGCLSTNVLFRGTLRCLAGGSKEHRPKKVRGCGMEREE